MGVKGLITQILVTKKQEGEKEERKAWNTWHSKMANKLITGLIAYLFKAILKEATKRAIMASKKKIITFPQI